MMDNNHQLHTCCTLFSCSVFKLLFSIYFPISCYVRELFLHICSPQASKNKTCIVLHIHSFCIDCMLDKDTGSLKERRNKGHFCYDQTKHQHKHHFLIVITESKEKSIPVLLPLSLGVQLLYRSFNDFLLQCGMLFDHPPGSFQVLGEVFP